MNWFNRLNLSSGRVPCLLLAAALMMLMVHPAQAQNTTKPPVVTATLSSITAPVVSVVNPVTNTIYVADSGGNDVAIVNGATNTITTTIALPKGSYLTAIAVDSLTNKIYVASSTFQNIEIATPAVAAPTGTITVIDGGTNATVPVSVGVEPFSLAVNPVTNKIYAADISGNQVLVIDGATNSATTVATGTGPAAVAVNSITNKIYVANEGSKNVTVIDGANQTTTTIDVGSSPGSIAVDSVTNQIYVTNTYDATVSVIDGASGAPTTIKVGENPGHLAVNPVTNRIYVLNGDGTVSVINGAFSGNPAVIAGTVTLNGNATAIAVDPATNRVYLAEGYSTNEVAVIDGASNALAGVSLTSGSDATSIAVNPITHRIYVGIGNVGYYSPGNLTVLDGATNNSTTIQVGSAPQSAAVNAITNKIYVANSGSNNATVIDGATGATTTVAVGTTPSWAAVNPITNQIYVANSGSSNVTVIDGATNNTTTVAAGTQPQFLAVNPVTNKIYVANAGSSSVTVIDGATNATATVATDTDPHLVVVDPVTNQVYIGCGGSGNGSVTVIDGATLSTASVPLVSWPSGMDVNAVTNKIYVANYANNTVTVIDGITNATSTIAVVDYPNSVAVNQLTNMIYVGGGYISEGGNGSSGISIIDGQTGTVTNVSNGAAQFMYAAVNATTNKIFVTNNLNSSVVIIDGISLTTSFVNAGSGNNVVTVNPMTNQAYVVNEFGNSITVIAEQQVQPIPLTASITPLANNQTSNTTPSFTFNASSTFAPIATTPDNLYFQVDTWQGNWNVATGTNPSYAATLAALQPGLHILYAYAVDGQESTSTQPFSPLTGAIQAYEFLVTLPSQTITFNPIATQIMGTTLTLAGTSTSGLPVTFSSSTTSVCAVAGNTASLITAGPCSITASQAGSDSYAPATAVSQTFSVVPPLTILTATAQQAGAGVNAAIQLTAQGGTGAYTWTLIPTPGPLPNGMQLIGPVISGTPTVAGTFPFTVQLSDAGFPGLAVTKQLSITVAPGPPASIAPVSGGGQSVQVNMAFQPLVVLVKDAYGNVTNDVSVTFAATGNAASGTFANGGVAISNAAGQATSPAFTANGTAGNFVVSASLTGLANIGPASFTETNTPAAASVVTATSGGGQSAHANGVFTSPFTVTVKDASGNLVANAGVVFTAPASGASGTFPGNLTTAAVQTNAAGVATSPAFTANATTGTYSVVAALTGTTAEANFSLTNLPGLIITTTALTSGTAGLAYSAPLTSQNGTAPYTWTVSLGTLPQGLTLNAQTGAITGIATVNGTFPFSVTVTDSTTPTIQTATQALSLLINTPGTVAITPTFTLSGIPATQLPATNITNGTVQLSQASAAAYSGALSLTFAPNAAGLPAGSMGDAGFVLPSGKVVTETLLVPAATTSVPLPTLDPGTVAGTITVSFAVTGETPVTSNITIEPAAPSFTQAPAFKNETATGFDVEVIATSTTRDLTTATFTFNPAPGAQISGATISVPVGTIMTQWFASAESAQYGGQFSLTVPFTLSGSMSAIQSVTVTLTNSAGTSAVSAPGIVN